CGPKAFQVLKAAGVKVYNTDAPTVEEALQRFINGQLAEAKDSDVEGHWV
ncbi:TPA: dinitrogenase iron-molybdenum cofactor biosynthesis protein, partial [Candidatus Edwardsbacteria bacterium]|nr:dinitrogenase iron-molybdenum cofactor biosynthesis protein [Candidatus Edwardsbacteria bacterium]